MQDLNTAPAATKAKATAAATAGANDAIDETKSTLNADEALRAKAEKRSQNLNRRTYDSLGMQGMLFQFAKMKNKKKIKSFFSFFMLLKQLVIDRNAQNVMKKVCQVKKTSIKKRKNTFFLKVFF